MKILVMGAGYVGIALLRYLQGKSYQMYITTTQDERVESLKPYGEDVFVLREGADPEFKEFIQSMDGVVTLVAPNKQQDYETVYLQTAKKISFALEERQKPFYIIYTSSTSVCEGIEQEWVTEETLLNPISKNAEILHETEQLYLNCGIDTCVLRLGGIYGPNRELADRARRMSGKEIQGTGDEPTNHIHLDDIVGAIAYCLDQHLTGIYHLVNDDHPTRKALYSVLCQQVGIPGPLWIPHDPFGGSRKPMASNQKIKDAGFVFKHPTLECFT